jgi:hypothetical protein
MSAMKSAGATLVDVTFPHFDDIFSGTPEFTVLLFDFKKDVQTYFATRMGVPVACRAASIQHGLVRDASHRRSCDAQARTSQRGGRRRTAPFVAPLPNMIYLCSPHTFHDLSYAGDAEAEVHIVKSTERASGIGEPGGAAACHSKRKLCPATGRDYVEYDFGYPGSRSFFLETSLGVRAHQLRINVLGRVSPPSVISNSGRSPMKKGRTLITSPLKWQIGCHACCSPHDPRPGRAGRYAVEDPTTGGSRPR